MIFITGDIHGDFHRIVDFCEKKETTKEDTLIILGDVGINYYGNKKDKKCKELLSALSLNIFCIHGNHENRPENIPSYTETEFLSGRVFFEEEYPNIFFAKDGEIYNINNKKTMVIGGAYSVDKYYRLGRGYSWWEDEQPSEITKNIVEEQLEIHNWDIDVFLTHTCPLNVIPKHLFLSGINQKTVDNSTEEWLQQIADKTNFEKWYFGHFHEEWNIDNYQLIYENFYEFI